MVVLFENIEGPVVRLHRFESIFLDSSSSLKPSITLNLRELDIMGFIQLILYAFPEVLQT